MGAGLRQAKSPYKGFEVLLIFGNGLGRSIDNEAFSLPSAIQSVCAAEMMPAHNLEAMKEFLAKEPEEGIDEDDLGILHQAIFACDFIAEAARDRRAILTAVGLELPGIFARFVHNVAVNLSSNGHQLPDDFSDALADFIQRFKPNVATLNYDQLLYRAFMDRQLLRGYRGDLVDGLLGQGYDHENLRKRFGNNFGMYLHLHGTPLVFEANDAIYKTNLGGLRYVSPDNEDQTVGRHLVLTNVNHKPLVIEQSALLSSYWRWFAWALRSETTDSVCLVGVGGQDLHLVRTINNQFPAGKAIQIVEWAGELGDRNAFWRDKFPNHVVEVQPVDCLVDFRDWDGLFA